MHQKVSVIMPVYNGSKFLGASIPSVLAQSLKDFELIIVDDCSNDDSRDLLKDWAAKDGRIRLYLNESNKGIFGSLNYLVSLAKNELIKIFCQDDVMMINCLERQVAFMNERPQLAYSRCLGTQELGKSNRMGAVDPFEFLPEIIYPAASAISFFTFGNIPGNLTNIILDKKALLNCGGFNQQFPYAGDLEAWSRIACNYPFGIQREALVYVHAHDAQGSVTLNRHNELIAQIDIIMERLFERIPLVLRARARLYGSMIYLVSHVSSTFRMLRCRNWRAAKLLFRERRYAYNASVGIFLYVVTCGRRWGNRGLMRQFVAEIHSRNSA